MAQFKHQKKKKKKEKERKNGFILGFVSKFRFLCLANSGELINFYSS